MEDADEIFDPDETDEPRIARPKLLALAIGISLTTVLVALASGLGGLVVGDLGAERDGLGGYDDGIVVSWDDRDYDAALKGFVVTGYTLTPGPGGTFPVGGVFDIVLARHDGTVLHRASNVVITDPSRVEVDLGAGVSIEDLERVAVSLEASTS